MQRTCPRLLCLPFLAAAALAQQSVVAPANYANTEANSSSGLPWEGTALYPSLRVQYVYDSTAFTSQNIAFPMVILGMRWRADAGLTSTGGTLDVTIDLASATVDHTVLSTTFASNLAANQLQVFSGPVPVAAAAGTTPNTWYADVTLTIPYVYDPTLGDDLAIDIGVPLGAWTGGTSCRQDMELINPTTLGSRVYELTSNTATVGTFAIYQSAVVEIIYAAPNGVATVQPFGTGCNQPLPLDLNASSRPILNTTANLVVSSIPANSQLGAMVFSLTQHNPGISTAPFGMPNCFQYVGLDVTTLLLVNGPTANYGFVVPNDPGLTGVHVGVQSAMFSPGANVIGIITSNGLDLGIGM